MTNQFTGYIAYGLGIAYGGGVTAQKLMTGDYDLFSALMAGAYILLGSFILGRMTDGT